MKRLLAFILLSLIVVSFVSGCKQAESSKNGNDVMPGYVKIIK